MNLLSLCWSSNSSVIPKVVAIVLIQSMTLSAVPQRNVSAIVVWWKMAERFHHQIKTNLTEQKYFAFDNKTSNGKQLPKYCCDQGRVLRGWKFLSGPAPQPQNLNPTRSTPQEFEKSCSLPPRTCPLPTSNPAQSIPARTPPRRTFSVLNPQLSENYWKLTTRASFCCNKIVRSMH